MLSSLLVLAVAPAFAASNPTPWNTQELYRTPKTFEASTGEPGVKAIFYESVPFHNNPTRVFAYYGFPARTSTKVPGMVLIHGGGGTAFAEWVRMWNQRGYAAIAMDTGGFVPSRAEPGKLWNPERARHQHSGPPGWGGFDKIDEPQSDHWTYHAVAAAVFAHSLLRSFPEVDPKRIGVTGISWGGYLTSIVSGVDNRFLFAAPVYGCGFLGEESAWTDTFQKMGPEKSAKWLNWWDPSRYLAHASRPMLWVNGTNDFAYPLAQWQKSYRLTRGPHTLTVPVRMPHGHPQGAAPEEIHAFADAMTKNAAKLPTIKGQGREENKAWVRFASTQAIAKAEFNFTRDTGIWKERKWETATAQLDAKGRRAEAAIPDGARVYYFNLTDARGLIVSTEHVVR